MRLNQLPSHKFSFLLWLATAVLMIASTALHGMQVELTTAVEGELQPTIKGTCNLPDGMKLILRVSRRKAPFSSRHPLKSNPVTSKQVRCYKAAWTSMRVCINWKS